MSAEFLSNTKAVVSVSEMARMVGLSRARFYQLIGSAFPHPLYSVATRRPIYNEEMQQICLEVRRRNCGIDGRPILFYARRGGASPTPRRPARKVVGNQFVEMLAGLRSLGLASATANQVEAAVKQLYPGGTADEQPGEVLRAVFVQLMRQNKADNVGR